MYFNIFDNKRLRSLRETQAYTLKINELYERLRPIFNRFSNEANKFYNQVRTYGFSSSKEEFKFNQYQQMDKVMKKFMQVCIGIIDSFNGNINAYFRYAKYIPMSHGSFFNYKRKFNQLVFKKYIDWNEHFIKSTRPNKIEYKYPPYVQQKICDEYFAYDITDAFNFQNFSTFHNELIKGVRLSNLADFSSMSDSTLRKILSKDKRFRPKRKSPPKDHPFRKKPKPSGHLQMDIKVFGRKQNGLNTYVYSFDTIETQTRIPHSVILEKADIQNVMKIVEETKSFYERLGIKIKLIRTDNAMMFKETNFVNSSEFNNFCRRNNIIHQFTPLGIPQANGCVERYHRTLDDELVPKLQKLINKKEMNECFKRYQNWFIHKRYMFYGELVDLPRQKRYMKPIDAINYFKKYNFNY